MYPSRHVSMHISFDHIHFTCTYRWQMNSFSAHPVHIVWLSVFLIAWQVIWQGTFSTVHCTSAVLVSERWYDQAHFLQCTVCHLTISCPGVWKVIWPGTFSTVHSTPSDHQLSRSWCMKGDYYQVYFSTLQCIPSNYQLSLWWNMWYYEQANYLQSCTLCISAFFYDLTGLPLSLYIYYII